ncbi:exopolysaccharide biosynthesis protein [filamentous cyanobacterium LEGE 11480]|uniref:Exopolysaccharide biosynthesis protein n=1 Tax=Romeriopsis navalis LEGE 11480 TaxID=2777977 RepID=A0A928VMA8_9CYAN|nr:GNVR domain-containing protein [Romeriopsis navalis]MBE9028464.1 exopolysaccharide biosynthesis protein [Romeriopsis navalis LEGE 11480]
MNRSLTIILRHWKPLLAWNLSLTILAAGALARSKPIWMANASFILSANTGKLSANLGDLGQVSDSNAFFSQQVNPLNVLASIVTSDDTMGALKAVDPEKDADFSLSRFKGFFKVMPEESSTIFSVKVTGRNQKIAQKRAEALVQVFQQRLNYLRQDDATQRAMFVQIEMDKAKRNLEIAQAKLTTFKKANGIVQSEEQTKQLVVGINSLTVTQADILAKAKAQMAQVRVLAGRLGMTPTQAIQSLRLNERSDYVYARQKLAEVEFQLAQARSLYQDNTPNVQSLLTERAEITAQIQQYVAAAGANAPGVNPATGLNLGELMQQLVVAESQANASQQQARQLQNRVQQLNRSLQALPQQQATLQELQRQYEISEGVYNGLVAKVQETRVNTFSNYPSVQVLDRPKVNPKPTGSKKIPILMGAVLASVLGSVALTLLRESRNPLLSPTDVQMSKIPVIGSLPVMKSTWSMLWSDFFNGMELQSLASSISMMRLENKRLFISSANRHEGKTTVTIGLAIALKTLGFQVLVVDADVRQHTLSKKLEQPTPNPAHVAVPVMPGIDLLAFTTSATQGMEFVLRGGFEHALNQAQMEQHYDYVLIDGPGICSSGESILLATIAKHILWVVRPGRSERFMVNKAIAQVARHQNIAWAGLVLNGTESPVEKAMSDEIITVATTSSPQNSQVS